MIKRGKEEKKKFDELHCGWRQIFVEGLELHDWLEG
jgi:hypothetical protein